MSCLKIGAISTGLGSGVLRGVISGGLGGLALHELSLLEHRELAFVAATGVICAGLLGVRKELRCVYHSILRGIREDPDCAFYRFGPREHRGMARSILRTYIPSQMAGYLSSAVVSAITCAQSMSQLLTN